MTTKVIKSTDTNWYSFQYSPLRNTPSTVQMNATTLPFSAYFFHNHKITAFQSDCTCSKISFQFSSTCRHIFLKNATNWISSSAFKRILYLFCKSFCDCHTIFKQNDCRKRRTKYHKKYIECEMPWRCYNCRHWT